MRPVLLHHPVLGVLLLLHRATAKIHCPHECPVEARAIATGYDCTAKASAPCQGCLACISGKDMEEYYQKQKELEATLLDEKGEIADNAEELVKEVLREVGAGKMPQKPTTTQKTTQKTGAAAVVEQCVGSTCPPSPPAPPPAPVMVISPTDGTTIFYADQNAITRFAFSRHEALRQGDVVRWVPYYALSCVGAAKMPVSVYGGELDKDLSTSIHLPTARIKYGLCIAERPDDVPLSQPWSPTDEQFSASPTKAAPTAKAASSTMSPKIKMALVIVLGVAFGACTLVVVGSYLFLDSSSTSKRGSGRRERASRRKGAVRVASCDPDELDDFAEEGGHVPNQAEDEEDEEDHDDLEDEDDEDDEWDRVDRGRASRVHEWQDETWDGARGARGSGNKPKGRSSKKAERSYRV